MNNYVLKYSKGESVKYISHLDFIRTFGRAVRRSGLQMSYSGGFNPHPILAVAQPLSVGVTSEGEYLRIRFEDDLSPDDLKNTLNRTLPEGLKILAAARVEGKEMDFAKLDRAKYLVEVELADDTDFSVDAFLANESVIVMKKTKSGEKEADIRSHIFELSVAEKDGRFVTLSMCISTGSQYNLKPDTVIAAMEKYIDTFRAEFFAVHRVSLLAENELYL